MVISSEDSLSPGGFLHSGAFLLVDKNRKIRGVYDGTNKVDINKLIDEIPILLNENSE